MHEFKFLLFGLFINFTASSQELTLCHDYSITGDTNSRSLNQLDKNCDLEDNDYFFRKVEKITSLVDRSPNFSVCRVKDLKNAKASLDNDARRFIIYDQKFIQQLDGSEQFHSTWILAHEVAHHLFGHTQMLFDSNFAVAKRKYCEPGSLYYDPYRCREENDRNLSLSRKDEIEADKFAGYIMQRMGATLSQAKSTLPKITHNFNDSLSTHPSLDKRLVAVTSGYLLAQEAADSGRKMSLSEIRGRSLKVEFNNAYVIDRSRLISRLIQAVTTDPVRILTDNNPAQGYYRQMFYQLPTSAEPIRTYLESRRDPTAFDETDQYFDARTYTFTNIDDPRLTFHIVFGFDIQKDTLRVIDFSAGTAKPIYNQNVDEDETFSDLTDIFVDIYKNKLDEVSATISKPAFEPASAFVFDSTTTHTVTDQSSQTGFRPSEPSTGTYISGFAKTYGPSGRVASLKMKVMSGSSNYDSLFFKFYYSRSNPNLLQYAMLTKRYTKDKKSSTFSLAGATEFGLKNTVQFDPITTHVKSFVELNQTYEYDSGRLVTIVINKGLMSSEGQNQEVRSPNFHYDSLGNLTSIGDESLRSGGSSPPAFRYRYDYNTRANGLPVLPTVMSDSYTFTLAVLMGWLPPLQKYLATSFEVVEGYDQVGNLYVPLVLTFSNYKLNKQKRIVSFSMSDKKTATENPDERVILNTYKKMRVSN